MNLLSELQCEFQARFSALEDNPYTFYISRISDWWLTGALLTVIMQVNFPKTMIGESK